MAVQRWVFDDGNGDTWTMSKNPTEMTSVHRERKVTVIGTTAKYVSAENAWDHIFGFMVTMDISDRGGRPI